MKSSNWTIGCEVLDRELAVFDEYKDFLPPLGIKRIRLQGGWARCEKEKGVYDFSWIDEPVDFCRAHGIEVLLETSYGNPIYEGAGGWDLGAGFPKSVAEPPRPCESRNDGAFRAAFRTVAPESGRVELLVTFGE